MPDQIFAQGPLPSPQPYTVPGSSEIVPLACFAKFDGTGAGGSFKPALRFTSQAGHVIDIAATDETIAAGASADVSWFPGVKTAAASAATGAVIRASADVSAPFTWGPGAISRNLGTIITNDATVFSNRIGFPKEIQIEHGGVMLFAASIEFAVNGVTPYNGIFDATVTLRDSLNTDVDELYGPIIYFSELYSTDVNDNFRLTGYSISNADDTFYTPPYHAFITWENNVNSTATSAAFSVAIENPAGLV